MIHIKLFGLNFTSLNSQKFQNWNWNTVFTLEAGTTIIKSILFSINQYHKCVRPNVLNAMKSSWADSHIRLFKTANVSETNSVSITRVLKWLDSRMSTIYSSSRPGLVKGHQPMGITGRSQKIAACGLASLWVPLFSVTVIWLQVAMLNLKWSPPPL